MLHYFFTLSRIAAAPLFFYLVNKNNLLLAGLLVIYALISDGLDGYFARLYNDITTFGAILDVIADKFFLYSVLISLHFHFNTPYLNYILLIWLTRDFILTSFFLFFKTKFKSLMIGKIYTVFQFIFTFLAIFFEFFALSKTLFLFLFILIFFILSLIAILKYYKFFKI